MAPINGDKVHVLTPFHSRSLYVENRSPIPIAYTILYINPIQLKASVRIVATEDVANEQDGKVNIETARIRVHISYIGKKSLVVLMKICEK